LHYFLKERPMTGSLQVGPPVADVTTPAGTTRTDEQEFTCETECTNQYMTVRTMLSELEASERLVADLSASAKVGGLFDLTAKGLLEGSERFRVQAVDEIHDTATVRETRTWTLKQTISIDGDRAGSPLYLASSYRKVGFDVYLAFIDHLVVRYERQGFQLRPRRVKLPAPTHTNRWQDGANVSPTLNVPLRSISFWELIQNRCPLRVGDYVPEVTEPHMCTVGEAIESRPTYTLPTEKVPSLYALSNAAFDLKWSDKLGAEPS
jgi:hypothetical protein